jgi:hypothetical protein
VVDPDEIRKFYYQEEWPIGLMVAWEGATTPLDRVNVAILRMELWMEDLGVKMSFGKPVTINNPEHIIHCKGPGDLNGIG